MTNNSSEQPLSREWVNRQTQHGSSQNGGGVCKAAVEGKGGHTGGKPAWGEGEETSEGNSPYRYLSVSQALPCPPEDNRTPGSGYSMSENSRRHVGVNKVASQEPLETWRS